MFNKPFKITTNYLFRYVLPPPSRPKYPDNNYLTAPLYNNYNRQTFQVVPIPPTAINSLYYNYKNNIVPSLGIQYIPNIGNRYTYVLPAAASTSTATTSTTTTTSATAGLYVKPDKLNGKYNPKLKKHKAYEKYNSNNKRSSYVSLKYFFQSKLYEFLSFLLFYYSILVVRSNNNDNRCHICKHPNHLERSLRLLRLHQHQPQQYQQRNSAPL